MFLYFFVLNLFSNIVFLTAYPSLWAVIGTVGMAGFFAFFEDAIVRLFKGKRIGIIVSVAIIVIHSILLLVDAFLLTNFGHFYYQEIGELLFETNSEQAKEFASAYFSFSNIIILFLIVGIINYIAWKLSNFCRDKSLKSLRYSFLFLGLILCSTSVYGKAVYNSGFSVPEFSTPIRFAYTGPILLSRINETKQVRLVCTKIEASVDLEAAPTVVVVIGESFSKYHCSLYGYEKQTYPLLQQRADSGELVLMNDAIAIGDLTFINMKAIFSLGDGGADFSQMPLFPACFKAAGYKTIMYDTQYIIGQGRNFLSDAELSQMMFDDRNLKEYDYDGEMIEEIELQDVPSLYVVHLWGQHFDYQNRYPEAFASFTEQDYRQEPHAKTISQYDNACLYNDFVVNELIRKFATEDVIIVYFSDHGEEIYEFGVKGHASALSSKDIRYQISVPMMVWMSKEFVSKRSDKAQQIRESAKAPIMTCEMSHFLLDVSGIQSPLFRPEKSFMNADYNVKKSRIVLKSLDFDQQVSEYAK